jgi:hypothetical protein
LRVSCGSVDKYSPYLPVPCSAKGIFQQEVPNCTFSFRYDTDIFSFFSENFIPGRSHPAKVLKSINIFDTELGELVNQLMTERDMDVKRLPGRPRRGDERPEKRSFVKKAGFFFSYLQYCFICRPSDSTVPTDAGTEPRTVATGALAVGRSNH